MSLRYLLAVGKYFLFSLPIFWLWGCSYFSYQINSSQTHPSAQGVRITAPPDVMVAIPHKQLQPYGFLNASQQEWVLSFRGQVIPYWVEGDDPKQLVFYSPSTRSPYWNDNVFLLQPKSSYGNDPDPEISAVLWQLEPPSASFREKQPPGAVLSYFFVEQNLLYQSLAEGGHWFWYKLLNKQEQEISINFEAPPVGDVLLRLSFYSATEAPAQPDHVLKVKINNRFPQEIYWDGKGYQVVEFMVSGEIFQKGENQLSLFIPDLEGVFAQVSYLDRVDIYYWQTMPFHLSQLRILTGDSTNIAKRETLVQDAWIWNIDDPLHPRQLEQGEGSPATGELKRYLWVNKKGFQSASDLRPLNNEMAQVQEEAEISYLVIGPNELLKPLQPLLEQRKEEGLDIKTVEAEEIYDQYYGFVEPQAIRAYLLKIAQEHPSLRYVLLVGDATYDPAQYITSAEFNRLPTFFIDTIFGGQTSTELPFSVLSSGNLDFFETASVFQPTIAVGRLPARSSEQVRHWVSKTLEYENGSKKPDAAAILAIADPHETFFSRDATTFTDLWGGSIEKDLFLPTADETELKSKIQRYFGQDYQMIAYFGHGAIDLWGKDEIFTAQEASNLTDQTSYPIVLNFTCLTGYYIHPEVMSLTESLLWNPKGGAILVIAPTSLTLAEDQSFLWKAFVESYQGREGKRIGDVWRDAISKITLTNIGIRDVVITYTLFGDPAMTLP